MIKRLYFIVILFIICGFTKDNYKIVDLSANGTKLYFYIPKDFCEFKFDTEEKILKKLFPDSYQNYNYYKYKKCSEVDKIKTNEEFNKQDNVLTIIIPKEDYIKEISDIDFAKKVMINSIQQEESLIKTLKKKLEDINYNLFLKNEKILERDKKYMKRGFDATMQSISKDTKTDYFIIDNNFIKIKNFIFDNENYSILNFSGFVGGLYVEINYDGEYNNQALSNKKIFADYIKNIQKLNFPKINDYYIYDNTIINIKQLNDKNFQDISHIKSIKNEYNRVFMEYKNDNNIHNITLSIKIVPTSEKSEKSLLKNILNRYINNNYKANLVKNKKYNYIKVLDDSNILYIYVTRIYNVDVFIFLSSSIDHDNSKKLDEKVEKIAEKYIDYLNKVNK